MGNNWGDAMGYDFSILTDMPSGPVFTLPTEHKRSKTGSLLQSNSCGQSEGESRSGAPIGAVVILSCESDACLNQEVA